MPVWPHPPLHAAYARRFRWMGCQAARRGASAALLEVRQEAMHGTDVRTDEAARWLQKSLKATAERACGKIGHHRKDAIMENHHKALDEIAQHARKVAERTRQPGNRGAVGFQRDSPEAIKGRQWMSIGSSSSYR